MRRTVTGSRRTSRLLLPTTAERDIVIVLRSEGL